MTTPALRLHAPDADPAAEAVPRRRLPADVIDAYWDDVEGRVGYVVALLDVERHSEALTLCATYLEGVAHALVSLNPRADDAPADEAEAHANDPFLSLVHPQQLVRVATQQLGLSAATAAGFAILFDQHEPRLLYQDEAVDLVRATLPPSEAALVSRIIWKCTIAYVIYDFLRSQSFRRREGARTIGLGAAFYEGETAFGLSVPELVALLRTMIAEARQRSHAAGRIPDTA